MAAINDQHQILPPQRSDKPSSMDEDLALIVETLALMNTHLQGLNNQSTHHAFPSLLHLVKHKTPYTGHLPMYLLWMPQAATKGLETINDKNFKNKIFAMKNALSVLGVF